MSDLWSDRIDLTDLEAVIDEHGGFHVAYNLHEDLLCVKEKAKADKLAMLGDIDETLESMSELVTKDGVSMFWVRLFDWGNKLDQLKQRIKDE